MGDSLSVDFNYFDCDLHWSKGNRVNLILVKAASEGGEVLFIWLGYYLNFNVYGWRCKFCKCTFSLKGFYCKLLPLFAMRARSVILILHSLTIGSSRRVFPGRVGALLWFWCSVSNTKAIIHDRLGTVSMDCDGEMLSDFIIIIITWMARWWKELIQHNSIAVPVH